MEDREIFFGNEGITSTKANHYCNLAKEEYGKWQAKLDGIVLYSTTVSSIMSNVVKTTQVGWDNEKMKEVETLLDKIARAKKLISWFREGIKARDAMLSELKSMTEFDYAEKFGIEVPKRPIKEAPLTRSEVIAKMSVKDRFHWFAAEDVAATFGDYIHPGGAFAVARADYEKRTNEPSKFTASGQDSLLYEYKPSVDSDVIEDVFFKLQQRHRDAQSEKNRYEFVIEKTIMEDTARVNTKFLKEMAEYESFMRELYAKTEDYKTQETKRIVELKLITPNDLKPILDEIASLGKKK